MTQSSFVIPDISTLGGKNPDEEVKGMERRFVDDELSAFGIWRLLPLEMVFRTSPFVELGIY